MSKQKTWRWGAVLLAAGALAGCESQLHISPDYGVAERQDVTAQIADPDAHYTGDPQPGSDATRMAAAQQRYVNDRVTQPTSTGTSSTSSGGGGSGGGGSGGGGGGGSGGGGAAGGQ
jgi:uncharacterized membrane protein YgcG